MGTLGAILATPAQSQRGTITRDMGNGQVEVQVGGTTAVASFVGSKTGKAGTSCLVTSTAGGLVALPGFSGSGGKKDRVTING